MQRVIKKEGGIAMKWEIRFYLTEIAFKSKIPAFKEIIQGNQQYVTNWAQQKIKHTNFKVFDIVPVK